MYTNISSVPHEEVWIDDVLRIVNDIENLHELMQAKAYFLGKNGVLTEALKVLGKSSPQERQEKGPLLHKAKEALYGAFQHREIFLQRKALEIQLQQEALDMTRLVDAESLQHLPDAICAQSVVWGCGEAGMFHPLIETLERLTEILASMGFAMRMGPDIEDEYYNFTALNIPQYHPARTMADTFYIQQPPSECSASTRVLRTHTSSVQIRTLSWEKPPLRVMSVGRTYRADSDRTHSPMFHQMEGLVLEEGVTMQHLRGCLEAIMRDFFAQSVEIRLRPSYFPFTSPSAEVDIRRSPEEDWLEVLGCGMVHPHVLAPFSLDAGVQGFAFGMGLERLTMLKYGIEDMRQMFANLRPWRVHYGVSVATGGL